MKAYSTLVAGDTGGGKTTLMREMHDRFPGLSVWVNHNGESNVAGVRARGAAGIRGARRNTVNLQTSDVNDGTRIAREVGREYFDRTGYPFQVVVDEAQNDALPDGSTVPDTPTRRGLHEDRDHGGKWVVATQDPSDLHYTPLKQCRWFVWCGTPSAWHQGFLDYWRIDRSVLPDDAYSFVVMDKNMEPVYRGETNPKYG